MTKKLSLLLLDAGVVIKLFELGLWGRVTALCDIHLSRVVVEREAQFYLDDNGIKHSIDLSEEESTARVTVFEVTLQDVESFRKRFQPGYIERLDPGESESLAHMISTEPSALISSADSIVFKALGALGVGEQGISLEEILNKVGLGRQMDWPYTKAFRERYTAEGATDSIQGTGLRDP